MVLVDTSVWISHLRENDLHLTTLLETTQVVCHPFVIGELACGNLHNRREILSSLRTLPCLTVLESDEILYFIEQHQLAGAGIGLIDMHLLASACLEHVPLWTFDKRLQTAAEGMNKHYIPSFKN